MAVLARHALVEVCTVPMLQVSTDLVLVMFNNTTDLYRNILKYYKFTAINHRTAKTWQYDMI